MRKVAASLGLSLAFVLSGCSTGIVPNSQSAPVVPAVKGLQGVVHGGQQAVTGATITLWAVGTTGDGSAATLLTTTTPVGSSFTLGTYTCPVGDPDVYITASGGNPGLGSNNSAILMMAALTDCNTLKANAATTFVWIDEVTTVGAVAALYPYMTSTSNLSYGAGDAALFATAFSNVSEYTNTTTGTSPGPTLPGGYYASSTEINTLGNILASCINSTGGVAGDGSACGNLFNLTKVAGVPATNTLGAMLNIINNPTQKVPQLFALAAAVAPFQPVDSLAPTSWALPILPMAATPTFSVAGGTYSSAQFVTLSDTSSGAAIYYTLDGSTPTSASALYNGSAGAITVSSSETINAIALASGYATSSVGSAQYTITGSTATYTISGQVILADGCGALEPATKIALSQGSTVVQTTTTSNGTFFFLGVPNDSYTITPSITGPSSEFYPASQTVTVSGSNPSSAPFYSNLGYTVSGTVAYSGSQTGQTYLALQCSNGGGGTYGTSISTKGGFIIHGVPPGSYTLQAFMDNLGIGTPNASNPAGSTPVTLSSANLINQNLTLADAGTVTLTSAPAIQGIAGFNSGAVVQYQVLTNGSNGKGIETPTSYTLQWSTDPAFGSVTGSHTFAANGTKANAWILNTINEPTLSGAGPFYFRTTAASSGTTAGTYYSSIQGPITIAAPTGANTVSGSVSFSETPSGPLYVGFLSNTTGDFYAEYFPNPMSAQAYSIQAPSDSYQFFAILDQNNDGLIDAGDIQDATDNGSGNNAPTVISGPTSNLNLTLPSANAAATVTTQNYESVSSGSVTYQSYFLSFQVNGEVKVPVAVELVSGPNLIHPVDIAICGGAGSSCGHGFQIYFPVYGDTPNVGDSYSFSVTYSDTTTATVTATVSAVLNVFPTNLSPQTGTSTSTTPTFSWSYPANPGNYTYQFILCCSSNSDIWDIPGSNSNANGFTSAQIPLGQIPWNTDPTGQGSLPSVPNLTLGTTYTWSIQLQDSNGNSAQTQVQYTP